MSLTMKQLKTVLQGKEILHQIDLEIEEGEFISLLGPSGCGKTTLLKSIAGLLEIEEGDIFLNETSIGALPPHKRGMVIVFQDLRLFPHMTVEKNIAFPMELNKVPVQEQREMVTGLLKEVQLEGFEKRKIRQLSGGQMQRVALARALAASPKVLLLDEPFSGLDEKLRIEMANLVRRIHEERKMTTILVTHDKREALQMSDRIALMDKGKILQYASPKEIFHYPVSERVAEYFGKANYIKGYVSKGRFSSFLFEAKAFHRTEIEGVCKAMVRPFQISLLSQGDYIVTEVVFMGELDQVTLKIPETNTFLKQDSPGSLVCQMMHQELEALQICKGMRVGVKMNLEQVPCFYEEGEEYEKNYI